jgi:hypothetical protein
VVESGPAVPIAYGMIGLKTDRAHNVGDTDLWFQRMGGQRVGPNKVDHITFHKERFLCPFGGPS